MSRKFQYTCVNPKSEEELTFIDEHEKRITYNTFIRNVDLESFCLLAIDLGYYLDSRQGLTIKNDWHISYGKSKLPNGDKVYI